MIIVHNIDIVLFCIPTKTDKVFPSLWRLGFDSLRTRRS